MHFNTCVSLKWKALAIKGNYVIESPVNCVISVHLLTVIKHNSGMLI